jgi:hypothetical protein
MLGGTQNRNPGCESLARFEPMRWLLSRDDVRFFEDHPRVAARFRRARYRVFLKYLRELDREIGAFHRESRRLIALGAWDLVAHMYRNRAVLLYHEARLFQAALYYRWLPADLAQEKVLPMVRVSLAAITQTVTA